MIKNLFVVFLVSFWASAMHAQNNFATIGDSVHLRINSNGSLGVNMTDLSPSSNANNQPNNHFLKQAGLYLVALDEDGAYHSAIQYLQNKNTLDFWPGPLDTLTGQTGNDTIWDNVWSLTKEEIEYHQKYWNTSGYVPTSNIANWPANGTGGFATYLAPFVDYNGDKVYNPMLGDYPAIRGKKSVYCIFNDKAKEHTASLGVELGIEVQLLAYQLPATETIYLEYYLINRSAINYSKVWISFVLDGQCGNADDNFAGTSQNFPQSVFVYNADDNDEGYFGTNLPFVSATFLNENMTSSIAFDHSLAANGAPKTVDEFAQIGLGNWKNGHLLQYGGKGLDNSSPASYIFGQSSSASPAWVEKAPINSAGRRTILGITERANWLEKEHVKLDIALNFGTFQDEESRIATIESKCAESVINYRSVSSISLPSAPASFHIYPNPSTTGYFMINSSEKATLQIFDMQGIKRMHKQHIQTGTTRCNVWLPPGVYVVQHTSKQGTRTEKLCITQN